MKQAELSHIDEQLKELYRASQIPINESGALGALDSLGLIHLIDKIENHFSVRVKLVDLDPVRMSDHGYLVQMVAKYFKGSEHVR